MHIPRDSSLHAPHRLRLLVGVASLVLPASLLASCDIDGVDIEPEHISLRPIGGGPAPFNFDVAIEIAGEDVVLDWSAQGDTVSVFRASNPALLASLPLDEALPAGVVEVALDGGATSYTDPGAADQEAQTPTYYYRVGLESGGTRGLSRMVMKTTTPMAPGYNKLGMCMLDGPARASDVVERLGSSVVGVWGWDAVNQSYIHWTPAQGVGGDADFAIGLGSVFAAQVDGSTPSFQSLVGGVPTNEAFTVTGRPGYNWTTIPVGYDGPATASYWVDQVGYWGMGTWNNLTQSASWYWGAGTDYADFGLEACQPYYVYLPDNACTSNEDCGEDNFCYFVDPAVCGDIAAGLCKPQPMGCEFAPQGEVCGCDEVTYASACEAEQAGASVAAEGACAVADPCDGNSCVNGACAGDGADYVCVCEDGWTGTYCEVETATACVETTLDDTLPLAVMGDLSGESDDYSPTCGAGGGADIAYQFFAPAAGRYRFDTIGTDGFDTMLAVFDQCAGVEVACHDDIVPGIDQDSVIEMELAAGQSVVIVVDSWDGVGGPFVLNIGLVTDEPPVDACESNPCVHGACEDNGGSYTCHCAEGYEGTNCETPVGEATCPCSDMPFWIAALEQAPTECTESFFTGGLQVNMYYPGGPYNLAGLYTYGTTCGWEHFPHVAEGAMTISAAEVEACEVVLYAWAADNSVVCEQGM